MTMSGVRRVFIKKYSFYTSKPTRFGRQTF